jgi:hypothetical protein
MIQNMEPDRKSKSKRRYGNGADTVMLAASPYKIWNTLKQFHPYKKEISILVRMLNKMGAKRTMIAAALCLQGWQNFCGVSEWTVEDVKDILEGYSA